ncbi:MAG: SGNH/GDSL hydrolase family protein [Sciscionella sp.]|nr:SGNH/GDSL hydrolase family protein [Sciscionella sp.]
MHSWRSFMAIGDSFTEGLDDPAGDGGYRGWADRLASMMAADVPDLAYANLAIRGKMLDDVITEQVPIATASKPDLITVCAGGNDIVVPGVNVDAVSQRFDSMIATLRGTGSDVLVFLGPDTKGLPVMSRLRGKVAVYNANMRASAEHYGAMVIDLWAMNVLSDPRAWAADRLHFSPEGHRRIALRTAELLGVPTTQRWDTPWPPTSGKPWLAARRADAAWAKEYLIPWIRRQLRGESMGDGMLPKRPELLPVNNNLDNSFDSAVFNSCPAD